MMSLSQSKPATDAAVVGFDNAGYVNEWNAAASRLFGYRYDAIDPRSDAPWPAMPLVFCDLARRSAEEGGFVGFTPDACLVNRYEPGTRLSLHQDKDELDFSAPIVSVSLGLPAIFLFGGTARSDKPRRFRLVHGDVAVWGGPSRLAYHGVAPLSDGEHALLGRQRINLTFRETR